MNRTVYGSKTFGNFQTFEGAFLIIWGKDGAQMERICSYMVLKDALNK